VAAGGACVRWASTRPDTPTRRIAIAAGLNAKTLSTYMGHATIAITLDRYGHLLPGNEAEARELLDAYLDAYGG
jgi:integrase